MPDWYPLIRTARYLGVPPWELYTAPLVWQRWGYAAQNAEIEASNSRNNK